MKRFLFIVAMGLIVPFLASAQQQSPRAVSVSSESGPPSITVKRTSEAIVLDGVLDEEIWNRPAQQDEFWQYFPSDSARANGRTEIYMASDEANLYVAVKCYSKGKSFIVPTLKRDYSFRNSDNISLLFDTFSDQNNAFVFGMNALGVRREALIANGGRSRGDFSDSWDNKWDGDAKIYDDYWIGEFQIPFKTIRFSEGGQKWRFNSYRNDTQINELSSWIRIPQNQIIMDLNFMGDMVWEEPLPKTGKNFSIIPYAIGGIARNYESETETSPSFTRNIGGDAKIALSSGLNLDLTVNPDFSQVEVDQQVTNLTRFEISFPERRQFFLENADLFSSFGNRRVNPFFSRRIGVAVDTTTGQNIQNPILYGARLSGKANDKLRVGLLNMQTANEKENGLPGFNYTVAALQQRVFERSNVSFIFVNKEAINESEFNGNFNNYNRVAGLEYRLSSANNRWNGKAFYHQAITPTEAEDKFSHGIQLEYQTRDYRLEWAQIFVGNGFDAEVGFVPRKDYFLISPEFELNFYPKSKKISQHGLSVDTRFIYQVGENGNEYLPSYGLADWQVEANYRFRFSNSSNLFMSVEHNDVFLFNDFDPTRLQADDIFLSAGQRYNYTSFGLGYFSNQLKKLTYSLFANGGQFYTGTRYGVRGEFSYRLQPFGEISLDYSFNRVKLADPFVPTNIWLVGPKFDITLSKKLFLTTFVQYNNQFDNLNINARFQWRFKPVSDFFIVYTDNYLVDPSSQFSVRNRALVAKVTYWLNL